MPHIRGILNTTTKTIGQKLLSDRSIRAVTSLTALLALAYVLGFTLLAFARMRYPFELEWIEGAYIDEVRWILAGQFPFSPPSINYIPTSKTPLFFYISALLMKVMGVSFIAPRLLSILATLGVLILLYVLVTHETGQPTAGILAAGIYAASYRFTGAWMDLAKTDSLFLFLLLLAFWVGYRIPKPGGWILSGLLFVMAFFTKQIALPIILAIALVSLFTWRGKTWLQWLSTSSVGIAVFMGIERFSHGWFSFYTLDTSLLHNRVTNLWLFWRLLLPQMWPVVLLSLVYCGSVLWDLKHRKISWQENRWNILGLGFGLILASWSIFFKTWTYDNGLLPASLGLALLGSLGFAIITKLGRSNSHNSASKALVAMSLILLITQFLLLFYNPISQLPTKDDKREAQEFTRYISKLPGEVWVFNHGFFNYLAGKTTYFHSAPFGDVVGGAKPEYESDTYWRREQTLQVYNQAKSEQLFNWVIVDKSPEAWLPYYVYVEDVPHTFYPVTGAITRPLETLVVNPVARGGEFPLNDPTYNPLFSDAWGAPEEWGRRSAGTSTINIALEQNHDYQMTIQMHRMCSAEHPSTPAMNIVTGWNTTTFGTEELTSCNPHTITYNLPSNIITKELNGLWFEFDWTVSSTDTITNKNAKLPEVGFTSIEFIQR